MNNLQAYNLYPKYNTNSKTITYTKSDNFYQYNTFWALEKSSQLPLFNTSCESLSIDKVINETNMDYGTRSFKKAPLRAKELKVRHILDNSATVHLVSRKLRHNLATQLPKLNQNLMLVVRVLKQSKNYTPEINELFSKINLKFSKNNKADV